MAAAGMMVKLVQCAALLGAVAIVGAQDDARCETATTCAECLPKEWCGWCSPGAVVYKNGTGGARCADQRDDSTYRGLTETRTDASESCSHTRPVCVTRRVGLPRKVPDRHMRRRLHV